MYVYFNFYKNKPSNHNHYLQEKRLDRVCGSMNGKGETIANVIQNYNKWKMRKAEIDASNKQRQLEMVSKLKIVLGNHLFAALKEISSDLQEKFKRGMVEPQDLDDYVQDALILFRKGRTEATANSDDLSNPSSIPQNDLEALHLFSDLVALLPDDTLREKILEQILKHMNLLDPSRSKIDNQQLPELNEDDLTETFVRGGGSGGQKINKTASKVLLIHVPTQIRVECQETRSLQQNRKIARKRMKLKLDEYINGSQSKTKMKIAKKVNKKQKARTRNKARQRKKKEANDESNK